MDQWQCQEKKPEPSTWFLMLNIYCSKCKSLQWLQLKQTGPTAALQLLSELLDSHLTHVGLLLTTERIVPESPVWKKHVKSVSAGILRVEMRSTSCIGFVGLHGQEKFEMCPNSQSHKEMDQSYSFIPIDCIILMDRACVTSPIGWWRSAIRHGVCRYGRSHPGCRCDHFRRAGGAAYTLRYTLSLAITW